MTYQESMHERTALLLGKNDLERIRTANILLVGTGGVGGWAAELLVRAGVSRMTIVDADCVVASNINRQLVATSSTIGKSKVHILRERLLDINPQAEIIAKEIFIKDDLTPKLFDEVRPTMVIDAIDSLSPKVHLIREAVERNIPIISSMGAGAKTDPGCIDVADISKSYNCTLARAVRKRLKDFGIRKGVRVVYSTELPNPKAVIAVEGERCKRSTAGTISYMPALFGCRLAAEALRLLRL